MRGGRVTATSRVAHAGSTTIIVPRDAPAVAIPAMAREVFDVSGAGDTAIALYTLALAAGCPAAQAAEISNLASGVVVAKAGTATLTPAELLEAADG